MSVSYIILIKVCESSPRNCWSFMWLNDSELFEIVEACRDKLGTRGRTRVLTDIGCHGKQCKKMCSQVKKSDLACGAEVLRYRLAVYNRRAKEKYVYFYVLDPDSMLSGRAKLRRIRKKFNLHKSAKANDAEAMRYLQEVNKKLEGGWNPLLEQTSKKSFSMTSSVIEKYKFYLKKLLKDEGITEKTHVDYSSRIKIFAGYIEKNPIPYIYMCDRQYIEQFLEYMYVEKDVSPRTRNNYLTFLSSLCSWMVECGYLNSNPCAGIKSLRNKEKIRKALSKADCEKLFKHLEEKDEYFLLACKFHYYTLIRPREMAKLKIGDISVERKSVFVSGKFSKNRKDAVVTIPKVLMKLMIDMDIFNHPSDDYIFSTHFMPGAKWKDSRQFTDQWAKVRDELKFPKEYQFYSLKDTGITNIINEVGLNVAKDQARHSSVAVTNAYASKEQMKAHPELFEYE